MTVESGARVRQVRLLVGETQTDLATEFGISQATWTRIESGSSEPDPSFWTWLSERTGLPASYFQRPEPPPAIGSGGTLQFREHSRLSKRERDRAISLAQIAYEVLLDAVAHGVELPALRIPAPSAVKGLSPEEAAEVTRESLGLGPDEPIQHLTRRLEKRGVRIFTLPVQYDPSKVARGVDAFSCWADDDAIIAVTQASTGDRFRMSIAHELGHLVMHSRRVDEATAEREAMEFASALLMPARPFRAMLPGTAMTVTHLKELKRHWRVSMAAAVMRAHQLRHIGDAEKTRLFRVLGARGWRMTEPIDIPRERGKLLRSALERVDGKALDIMKAARRLDLNPSILAGLLEGEDHDAEKAADVTPLKSARA